MSAGETTLTITGNLTDDPELRFTGTGTAGGRVHRRRVPPRL